jgi:hypothetical protein
VNQNKVVRWVLRYFSKKEEIPYDEMMPVDKGLFQNIFEGKNSSWDIVLRGKDKEPTYRFT